MGRADDDQVTRWAMAAGAGDRAAAEAFVQATQARVGWFLSQLTGGRPTWPT